MSFRAELKKAYRRHDIWITLLIAGVVLIFCASNNSRRDLEVGYSALFYTIPIINTLIMSTGMAVLASRIWDIETKGNTCKLLFTLQNRSSLYYAKALLGIIEIFIICIIECIGVPVIGKYYGYTEVLDMQKLCWLFVGTFTVCLMLFLFACIISICSQSQVPVLAVGIAGSFFGLFSGFCPVIVGYFVPWGYFLPLSPMEMEWNHTTRETWYIPHQSPLWLFIIISIFILLLLFIGLCKTESKEV